MQIVPGSVIRQLSLEQYNEGRKPGAILTPEDLSTGEDYVARLIFRPRRGVPSDPTKIKPEKFKVFAADVLLRLNEQRRRTGMRVMLRIPEVDDLDLVTTQLNLDCDPVAKPQKSVMSDAGLIYKTGRIGMWPLCAIKFHDELGYFPNAAAGEDLPHDDDRYALPVPTSPAPVLSHV